MLTSSFGRQEDSVWGMLTRTHPFISRSEIPRMCDWKARNAATDDVWMCASLCSSRNILNRQPYRGDADGIQRALLPKEP